MAEPTYIFRDGNVYTLVEGKVVSSVKEADFQEPVVDSQHDPAAGDPVEMPPPPADIQGDLSGNGGVPCPGCGNPADPSDKFCPECGSPLGGDTHPGGELPPQGNSMPAESYGTHPPVGAQPIAHTITTPNGLKGRVLGRTAGLWGDQVTVRLENGTIKQLHVAKGMEFTASEDSEPEGPVAPLRARLEEKTAGDRDSLVKRLRELLAIKRGAANQVDRSSDTEAEELNEIIVQAIHEAKEVEQAIQHLAELEGQAFEPVAPIESLPAVEQESLGGNSANWLDRSAHEVATRAEATNFTKLMDEGPEVFVAGVDDDDALEDSTTTREMASRWIRSHTVGTEEDVRDRYENVFLARVEDERQRRLATRKEEVQKEASSEEPYDGPDDALFL